MAQELDTDTKSYLISASDKKQFDKLSDRYEQYTSENTQRTDYLAENNLLALDLTDSQLKTLERKNDALEIEEDIVLNGSSEETESLYEQITKPVEQWNLDMIGAAESNSADNHIKIGIIDTGVCASAEIPIAGRINLVPGEEDVSPLYEDISGHGTSIASIIGAVDDGVSMKGVNPDAEMYSIKALNDGKSAPLSRVVEGIYWCIDHNMNIINMSFGTHTDSSLLHQAVIDAYNAGILMIAAAGNTNDGDVEYPAAYDEVVAVGSINNNADISDFSATGEEIELVAPGEEIAATGFFDEVVNTRGTSVATAQVTGVASLLWDYDTTKDANFIRALLADSAKSLGNETTFGNGIIDAEYALSHYEEFAQSYTPQDREFRVLNNTDPVSTYTDDEVHALWSGSDHKTVINGLGYSNDKEMLLKFGCKMSDYVLREIINKKYTVNGVLNESAAKKANHQFHGVDNYVANYMFLAKYAFNLKNHIKPTNLRNLYPVADFSHSYAKHMVKNSENVYIEKEYDYNELTYYLFDGIKTLEDNWSTVYKKFYEDATGKKAENKKIGSTDGHNSLIILGMAIHCAMDAYDNSSIVFDESIGKMVKTKSQNTNVVPARYQTAKAVGLSIIKKWNSNNGEFQLSEFYQSENVHLIGTKSQGGFYLENFLQIILDVKPNLEQISSTKFWFFANRSVESKLLV